MPETRTYRTTSGDDMQLPPPAPLFRASIRHAPAELAREVELEALIAAADRRIARIADEIDSLRRDRAEVGAYRRHLARELRALRDRAAAQALNLERH